MLFIGSNWRSSADHTPAIYPRTTQMSQTALLGPLQPLSCLLLASLGQRLAQDFVENDDPVVDANVL
jgi:hypothetical protein